MSYDSPEERREKIMMDTIKSKDAEIARLKAEKAQKQLVIDDCKRNLQEQDAAIAALRGEVERLSKDRKEVLSYLQAVSNCALQHPEGYTLIDFQQVWLAQKTRENEALRTRVEQAEKELAAEREKSKCNHEWKEWTSTAGRTRQCIKCGQQYSWFG